VDGWRPRAVACLGAAYNRLAAVTGTSPLADLAAGGADPVPFLIAHGTADTVVLAAGTGLSCRRGSRRGA
jgi:hypothetical protein